MSTKPKPAARDERADFLLSNLRTGGSSTVKLSAAALADLRYFSDRAAEGMAIKFDALSKWMREKHSIVVGKTALHRAMTAAGLTPWFATK